MDYNGSKKLLRLLCVQTMIFIMLSKTTNLSHLWFFCVFFILDIFRILKIKVFTKLFN